MSNTLGPRRYYEYTADNNGKYKYLTDQDLGTAVNATLNDSNPDLPRRFKPRGVYVEAEVDGQTVRKFVICPATSTAAYAATASTTVTIDETEFKTTGRVGERQTFGANPENEGGEEEP